MARKNRQKHRQNDWQFAALPPGLPATSVLVMAGSQAGSSAGVTAFRPPFRPRRRAGLMETVPSPTCATLLRRYQ